MRNGTELLPLQQCEFEQLITTLFPRVTEIFNQLAKSACQILPSYQIRTEQPLIQPETLTKMFLSSDPGLRFEVTFCGKEEFGVTYEEILGKAWILADSDKDIILDFKCFNTEEKIIVEEPELLVELYVDGVIRNVIMPRSGRCSAENQLAEAVIDRGVVLGEDGMPRLKGFRFTDLDIDDGKLELLLSD